MPAASITSKLVIGMLIVALLGLSVTGWYWSREPDSFNVETLAKARAERQNLPLVTGFVITSTLMEAAETLLNKPGGYLSNDIAPPGIFLDNIPNWEFGVIVQTRDLARALRNNMSRSQSQSTADPDLEVAEPQFNFDSESWLFPPTESEYTEALEALERYLHRLANPGQRPAQFFARADNLNEWLRMVEVRLGSLSQRLSASVGQIRVNTDLAGEPNASRSTSSTPDVVMVKTPWLEIDDVFFEARGSTWALIHFLKAAEIDFAQVLARKNATVSLRQIIRELEATQQTVMSPIILNGGGFGFFANHSLVLASYISRANAAVIDLRRLLEQG